MILDALLVMADAQTGTTSAASTDYIDTLAAGDAYIGAWLNVRVDTTYTAAVGTPTATFALQTADTTDFLAPDAITVAQSAALGTGSLVAGNIVWQIRLPQGMRRYIRVYKTVTAPNNNFSAGAYDAFLTKDVDNTMVLA